MRLRSLLLALTVAVLGAACGDSPSSPSKNGSVNFRLDGNSCGSIFGTSTLTFTFFIDGNSAGSASLGIGITSPSYSVLAGSHAASASVANSSVRWQNLNFTVTAGQTFTYILLC
jgi:hypothetical protein